jgi:hypothetical protein
MSTSEIDEKKNKKSEITQKITTFIKSITGLLFFLFIYFLIGILVLYGCKVAQSNILPTNINCFPFTENKSDLREIPINIFVETINNHLVSDKISFTQELNKKNILIDILREEKLQPFSHFLANYFISIIDSLIALNSLSLNVLLNGINSLPELFIIFLGPILFPIYFSCIFVINCIYYCYLWFAKMSWFFKQNINKSEDSKPNWQSVSLIDPVNFGFAFLFIALFTFLFFTIGFATLPVLPMITIIWSIITCLTTKSTFNENIYIKAFSFFKVPFMMILSVFIILTVFSILGQIPGMLSIVTLLLIYFNILPIDMFKKIIQENKTPIVSYEQAKKICRPIGKNF